VLSLSLPADTGRDGIMKLKAVIRYGAIALKRIGVPLYMSKFSRKDFTLHQHLLMLGFKEMERTSFREAIDRMDDFSLQDELELSKLPHYTTLQKVLARIPPRWFLRLLFVFICFIKSSFRAVFDATGLRPSKASLHYIQRIGKKIRKRDYLKGMFCIDYDIGLIVSCWGMNGRYHESPRLWRLINGIPGKLLEGTGDKGFDSEKNQRLIAERKAKSYIDVRSIPRRGRLRKSVFRRKMKYPKRWKNAYKKRRNYIESTNASFKRIYGESISGNTVWMQRKILYIRVVFYDFHLKCRRLSLFVIEGFYSPV
jgi:hypothetical protein